jgi:hypothetical protein
MAYVELGASDHDPDKPITTGWGAQVRLNFIDHETRLLAATGLKFLSSQVISNDATIDFTSGIDSTYPEYVFLLENVVPTSDGADLFCRLAVSGVFQVGASDYRWQLEQTANDVQTLQQGNTDNEIALIASSGIGAGSASGEGVNGQFVLTSPSNTTILKKTRSFLNFDNSGGLPSMVFGIGRYETAGDAIDGVRFFFSTGNLESGTIRMYGVRGS